MKFLLGMLTTVAVLALVWEVSVRKTFRAIR